RKKQLDAYPEQQQSAHYLQIRNRQQCQGECNQRDAQENSACRSPQYALHPLFGFKIATGQGNYDRIVAPQQDVDHDDLENRCPTERLEKLKHVVSSRQDSNRLLLSNQASGSTKAP